MVYLQVALTLSEYMLQASNAEMIKASVVSNTSERAALSHGNQ